MALDGREEKKIRQAGTSGAVWCDILRVLPVIFSNFRALFFSLAARWIHSCPVKAPNSKLPVLVMAHPKPCACAQAQACSLRPPPDFRGPFLRPPPCHKISQPTLSRSLSPSKNSDRADSETRLRCVLFIIFFCVRQKHRALCLRSS